jgi:hypothetical protein
MAVGRGDEASGHVVAKQRNLRDVGSILYRQDAAGVGAVLGVPQRRVEAEGDARQVDAVLRAETPANIVMPLFAKTTPALLMVPPFCKVRSIAMPPLKSSVPLLETVVPNLLLATPHT